MFAAQAGSQRVYAVERTTIVRLARRFLKRNGFDDRIVVMRGNVDRVELPEKVDVIVSGWLAMLGVEENMLAPVLRARDRWLKPEGRMPPERVTAWIAPDRLAAHVQGSAEVRGIEDDNALGAQRTVHDGRAQARSGRAR